KHLMRIETRQGLALPERTPVTLVITHQGSGQEARQALVWRKTRSGGLIAISGWQVPPAAKLGVYEVTLEGKGDDNSFGSSSFRVEEFRLPVFEGRLNANDKKPLIAATAVP